MPFKKENLENDPIATELLQENNQQHSNDLVLTLSTNHNIIRRNTNGSSESDNNRSNFNTEFRFNNPNEEIIHGESEYRENGPKFIIKFHPNKTYCIFTLLLNLIPGGLGSILIGINRGSLKYLIGGIIHFILIDFLLIMGVLLLIKKELFKQKYNIFLPIYLLITSGFFYLISIYIELFNNFIFINTKRLKKYHPKEIGIFILLLNIFIPGLGTLMIQSVLPNKCIIGFKRTINGLGQLIMFIILFIFYSGISSMNANLLLFIFLTVVEYLYTLGTSVCFLRNITISEDIANEIEDNN